MRKSTAFFASIFLSLTASAAPLRADGDPGSAETAPAGKVASSNASTREISNNPNASAAALGFEKATGPKLSRAMGHYARARSLLIAAIQEFDKGYAVATPDAILDSKAWRTDIIDRTRELERVLDPQPRVSNSGVSYTPDSRLLKDPR